MTKKDQIIEEIRKIYDPELPVNIYELGLIYDVQVENESHAKIKMTLIKMLKGTIHFVVIMFMSILNLMVKK